MHPITNREDDNAWMISSGEDLARLVTASGKDAADADDDAVLAEEEERDVGERKSSSSDVKSFGIDC